MGDILNKLGGQPVLSPPRATMQDQVGQKRQPENGSLAADRYVETIPYSRNAQLCQSRDGKCHHYDVLLGGSNQPISQRMGAIAAKY